MVQNNHTTLTTRVAGLELTVLSNVTEAVVVSKGSMTTRQRGLFTSRRLTHNDIGITRPEESTASTYTIQNICGNVHFRFLYILSSVVP